MLITLCESISKQKWNTMISLKETQMKYCILSVIVISYVLATSRGGQSTQLHYLSESTDTNSQILLHYKLKL